MVKYKELTLRKIAHGIKRRFEQKRWLVIYPLARRVLPITNNRVCFISWSGSNFNCNPKAMATYMSRSDHADKYELIAVVDKPKTYEAEYPGIHFVRTMSIAHIVATATCRVFVANVRMGTFKKRDDQFYIQTWHGFGPKKSEKDSVAVLSADYVNMAIKDCEQTDLMLSGSSNYTGWIRNSTWYKGKILECGLPRYDDFFNEDIYRTLKQKVYDKYHLDETVRLVMYAPTFRSLKEIDNYGFNSDQLVKCIENKLGGKWKLLLRFHPNVASFPLPEIFAKHLSSLVVNATRYDDMQDLLCAADILITDFSSVSTEFAVQKKPCFLYAPDYKEYDRGLYMTPDQLPFPFAETEIELIENIRNFDEKKYSLALDQYSTLLGMKENGRACEIVTKEIDKVLWPQTQE